MGGMAVDITTEPFATRRSVYAYIERQNLPGLFRTFDFANPDTTSAQRFYTTVPQQALFLLNSPFAVQQAQGLLARPEIKSAVSDDEKVRQMYRVAFQRSPDADELQLARDYIAGQKPVSATRQVPSGWHYGYGAFDEKTGRVSSFRALPHFTGAAWQGGKDLPDAKLGWVILTAEGGHAGDDAKRATIRRWIAPHDGVVSVSGRLGHSTANGDGVRGRIVSNTAGKLGEWVAHNSKATTNVERVQVKLGDWIDFVVDCRASVNSDSFTWAPTVRYSGGADADKWSAKADFSGPKKETTPLTAWERYAQALLLSNELMFVD
jgi:hypothetical protein